MRESLTDKEKAQEKFFDNKAGKEMAYHVGGRDNRNHEIKINAIIDALQLKQDDNVLEVGVGKGEHAYKCLKYSDAHFTGIDISQKTLEVAENRIESFKGRYCLKKDNANDLSFGNNTFDAVFCAATLHHMDKPGKMISEMSRVLKPGGRIAIMEPNWIYPSNLGFTVFLKEDRHMWIMRRNNFYKWMGNAGLKNIHVENLIYTPPVPKAMIPLYDLVDNICSKLPLIQRCSLMLFGSATK